MPDNLIQIAVKVNIQELQANLQEGADTVKEQTDDMASQFKSLAKESKTALDDVEKAAKLSGFEISDEMASVLEQVPKVAKGLADVFAGGGLGAFVGVLLQAGIALKGLYDDVVLLKGAKAEWAAINKTLSESEDILDAKIRQNTIEHIRLTQGDAAAAHAAVAQADKDIVGLGKEIDRIMAGKDFGKLPEDIQAAFKGLNHITFEQLDGQIQRFSDLLKQAKIDAKNLEAEIEEDHSKADVEAGDTLVTNKLDAKKTELEARIASLQQAQKVLNKFKDEHERDKQVLEDRAKAADASEYEQAQRKQMDAFRQRLQDQKDALDAFHTMSKEAEAKYWDDIIATGKAKGETLKEVQRLRLDAQKDAQRQTLQDEVEKVQEEVSASKAGSQQRVQLLDQEIQKLKAKHQDATQEYKRLVKERAQAEKEFEDKSLRDEIEATREKVADTKAGSQLRVQILDQELQKLRSENKADTDEYKRLLKEKEQASREYDKAEEAEEEAAKKRTQEVAAIRLQTAVQHAQALRGIAQSWLEFEKQIGHISEAQYEEELRAEVTATYNAAMRELEAKKALYKKDSTEYAKVEAEIVKLTDKYNADIEKAEEKSLLRRRQQFDQFFKQISGGFNTALNSWMQGSETAGQAFGKMFQSILSQLVSFVEQWIEQKIEMWLMDALISDQGSQDEKDAHILTDIDQIMADAYAAAANAYAANAYDPITAELMAADAFATVSGFGASASALMSGAGGIYQVPFDTIAAIHKDEQVLPATYAQGLRNMIAGNGGAGGGITVVVNHSVNAIDAESFQVAIRKHGNMIGNEVARVLRKKNIA